MSISSAVVKSSGLVRALSAKGILDPQQLDQMTSDEIQGRSVAEWIVNSGIVSAELLASSVAQHFGYPLLDLGQFDDSREGVDTDLIQAEKGLEAYVLSRRHGTLSVALAEMGGLKGRGARHSIAARGGPALLIDESYNANPASMRATLKALAATPATRRIAVLGSMKELGDFADAFHRQLAEPLAEAGVAHTVLVGEEMRALAEELGKLSAAALGKPITFAHCGTPAEAIALLGQFGLAAGDAVLVKGSNSVGLGRLVSHFIENAPAGTGAGG